MFARICVRGIRNISGRTIPSLPFPPGAPGPVSNGNRSPIFLGALRFPLSAAPFTIMIRLRFPLLLLCAACVEKAPIEPFPEQIIPAQITASDRDLQPGENSTLTVTLTNTLEDEVQLVFPTSCQALVFIKSAAGRIMTPASAYECAAVPSLLTLAAGASKTYTFVWGGGVEFGPAGTSTRLPPGSYYASAEMRADNYLAIAFPITIVVH